MISSLFPYPLLWLIYILCYAHTHRHTNFPPCISPFLLKCLSEFVFLLRSFRYFQITIYTVLHPDPLETRGGIKSATWKWTNSSPNAISTLNRSY